MAAQVAVATAPPAQKKKTAAPTEKLEVEAPVADAQPALADPLARGALKDPLAGAGRDGKKAAAAPVVAVPVKAAAKGSGGEAA